MTPQIRIARRENRAASQPVIGVAIAVAMMLKVTNSAIWSVVAESVPCICGSDTFAMVTVIAYSVVTSVSVVRIIARVNAEGPGTAIIGTAARGAEGGSEEVAVQVERSEENTSELQSIMEK